MIKAGDIVKCTDGSYSYAIGKDGKLNGNFRKIRDFKYEVIGANCRLPTRITIHGGEGTNDTILRNLEDNEISFNQERFLMLAHRCNSCPNCGEKI